MLNDSDLRLGAVVSVGGAQATARLSHRSAGSRDGRVTVGRLVGIATGTATVVGVVSRLAEAGTGSDAEPGGLLAEVDLLGEIRPAGTTGPRFRRGVSDYPTIGDPLGLLGRSELALVHRIDAGGAIEIGRLALDPSVPALLDAGELLHKHFAVLGSTGVGKSTAVSLILNRILARHDNLRIFLIDPHNEYADCFGDKALVVTPKTLRLPFWLFNFEEIVDVFFRGRPGVEEETDILAELIPAAKAAFAASGRGEPGVLRKDTVGFTADTPVPYRMSDLLRLISEARGRLDNRAATARYQRLAARIESLGNDARYGFMFSNLFVEDMMGEVIRHLFRIPVAAKPVTVMQLAGLPAEVVDAVVSVLCRMAFECGLWTEAAFPVLVACEEAHRYAPADRRLGFGPTRKALSRIAKEGRKYGVFLAVITQRPTELDATILSQCSTLFAMRMANDRDQEIVRAAVPDAGAGLLDFLPALGTAEAVVFGEGVALPTRIRFAAAPREQVPRGRSGVPGGPDASEAGQAKLVAAAIGRWREATTSATRPRIAVMGIDRSERRADDGRGPALSFAPSPTDHR